MTTLFNLHRVHINTTTHIAKYWREQGQPWIIQTYWDDEKELRLLAFAKALVLRIGVEGVADLMKEDVSDGNP